MAHTAIEVTTMDGEQTTWNISTKLGDAYLFPIRNELAVGRHPHKESLALLTGDPALIATLQSMLISEVSDNATVARKDGVFGVLYFRNFDCAESEIGSYKAAPSRGRVIRRIQADILSEISLNPRFPKDIDIAIPASLASAQHQVTLWIFVPQHVFTESGNWDVLEDVVSLLLE